MVDDMIQIKVRSDLSKGLMTFKLRPESLKWASPVQCKELASTNVPRQRRAMVWPGGGDREHGDKQCGWR